MKKNLRDTVVVVLGLGVAYGMGIITCLYCEAKLLVDAFNANEKR